MPLVSARWVIIGTPLGKFLAKRFRIGRDSALMLKAPKRKCLLFIIAPACIIVGMKLKINYIIFI
jgi:hypothetical protein